MLRRFQVLLFLGALSMVCGCAKQEVEEIPATEAITTPEPSAEEKKNLMEGEKKANEKAAKHKQGAEQKKKKKS